MAAALVILAAAVLSSIPAQAHATLVATFPSYGAVLETAPERVTLSFNEPVSPISARLVDPEGDVVELDDVTSIASDLIIGLPSEVGEGSFVLSWRAVSDDGHPISGMVPEVRMSTERDLRRDC